MSYKKIKTLIVGAYPNELKPFCDLGRTYQKVEGDVAYLSAGIGPVAASFGLTHFLEDYRPEQIIAVGTAGVVPCEYLQINDVVRVAALSYEGRGGFHQADEVYVPEMQVSVLELPTLEDFSDLPGASVFAPQEISRGEGWSSHLKNLKYEVEHLESFAYAFVAQKFKIPVTILLGLTNHIGRFAHKEWMENEQIAMQKIVKILKAKRVF